MQPLETPVVLLTGASRGLGLAILRILLEKHNARIATLSRSSPPEFQELVKRYSDRILPTTGDIGDADTCAETVEATVKKWHRLDTLILNAGSLGQVAKVADLSLYSIPAFLNANLASLFYTIQPALPHLRRPRGHEPGRIICISSGASTGGYQAWSLYNMAKAGMNSLCRTLQSEEGGNGVVAIAVRPGMIDTSMQQHLRDHGKDHMSDSDMAKFVGAFESGSLLPPERPGAVLAALALHAPAELGGEYINWEDPRLAQIADQ